MEICLFPSPRSETQLLYFDDYYPSKKNAQLRFTDSTESENSPIKQCTKVPSTTFKNRFNTCEVFTFAHNINKNFSSYLNESSEICNSRATVMYKPHSPSRDQHDSNIRNKKFNEARPQNTRNHENLHSEVMKQILRDESIAQRIENNTYESKRRKNRKKKGNTSSQDVLIQNISNDHVKKKRRKHKRKEATDGHITPNAYGGQETSLKNSKHELKIQKAYQLNQFLTENGFYSTREHFNRKNRKNVERTEENIFMNNNNRIMFMKGEDFEFAMQNGMFSSNVSKVPPATNEETRKRKIKQKKYRDRRQIDNCNGKQSILERRDESSNGKTLENICNHLPKVRVLKNRQTNTTVDGCENMYPQRKMEIFRFCRKPSQENIIYNEADKTDGTEHIKKKIYHQERMETATNIIYNNSNFVGSHLNKKSVLEIFPQKEFEEIHKDNDTFNNPNETFERSDLERPNDLSVLDDMIRNNRRYADVSKCHKAVVENNYGDPRIDRVVSPRTEKLVINLKEYSKIKDNCSSSDTSSLHEKGNAEISPTEKYSYKHSRSRKDHIEEPTIPRNKHIGVSVDRATNKYFDKYIDYMPLVDKNGVAERFCNIKNALSKNNQKPQMSHKGTNVATKRKSRTSSEESSGRNLGSLSYIMFPNKKIQIEHGNKLSGKTLVKLKKTFGDECLTRLYFRTQKQSTNKYVKPENANEGSKHFQHKHASVDRDSSEYDVKFSRINESNREPPNRKSRSRYRTDKIPSSTDYIRGESNKIFDSIKDNLRFEQRKEVECYDVGTSTILDNNLHDVFKLLKNDSMNKQLKSWHRKSIFHATKTSSYDKLVETSLKAADNPTMGYLVKGIEPAKRLYDQKNTATMIRPEIERINKLECKVLSVLAIAPKKNESKTVEPNLTLPSIELKVPRGQPHGVSDRRLERLQNYYRLYDKSEQDIEESFRELISNKIGDCLHRINDNVKEQTQTVMESDQLARTNRTSSLIPHDSIQQFDSDSLSQSTAPATPTNTFDNTTPTFPDTHLTYSDENNAVTEKCISNSQINATGDGLTIERNLADQIAPEKEPIIHLEGQQETCEKAVEETDKVLQDILVISKPNVGTIENSISSIFQLPLTGTKEGDTQNVNAINQVLITEIEKVHDSLLHWRELLTPKLVEAQNDVQSDTAQVDTNIKIISSVNMHRPEILDSFVDIENKSDTVKMNPSTNKIQTSISTKSLNICKSETMSIHRGSVSKTTQQDNLSTITKHSKQSMIPIRTTATSSCNRTKGRSLSADCGNRSTLFFTKTFNDPTKMSAYEKRKLYSSGLRSNLKKRSASADKGDVLVPPHQIYEVRYFNIYNQRLPSVFQSETNASTTNDNDQTPYSSTFSNDTSQVIESTNRSSILFTDVNTSFENDYKGDTVVDNQLTTIETHPITKTANDHSKRTYSKIKTCKADRIQELINENLLYADLTKNFQALRKPIQTTKCKIPRKQPKETRNQWFQHESNLLTSTDQNVDIPEQTFNDSSTLIRNFIHCNTNVNHQQGDQNCPIPENTDSRRNIEYGMDPSDVKYTQNNSNDNCPLDSILELSKNQKFDSVVQQALRESSSHRNLLESGNVEANASGDKNLSSRDSVDCQNFGEGISADTFSVSSADTVITCVSTKNNLVPVIENCNCKKCDALNVPGCCKESHQDSGYEAISVTTLDSRKKNSDEYYSNLTKTRIAKKVHKFKSNRSRIPKYINILKGKGKKTRRESKEKISNLLSENRKATSSHRKLILTSEVNSLQELLYKNSKYIFENSYSKPIISLDDQRSCNMNFIPHPNNSCSFLKHKCTEDELRSRLGRSNSLGGFFNYQKFVVANNDKYASEIKTNKVSKNESRADDTNSNGSSNSNSVTKKRSIIELFKIPNYLDRKRSSISFVSDREELSMSDYLRNVPKNNSKLDSNAGTIPEEEYIKNFHQIIAMECQKFARKVCSQSLTCENDGNNDKDFEEIPLVILMNQKSNEHGPTDVMKLKPPGNSFTNEDCLVKFFGEDKSNSTASSVISTEKSDQTVSSEQFRNHITRKTSIPQRLQKPLLRSTKGTDSITKFNIDYYPQERTSIEILRTRINLELMPTQNTEVYSSSNYNDLNYLSDTDLTQQTEKQFFDSLLTFYDKEMEIVNNLIHDNEFFVAQIEAIRNLEDASCTHRNQRSEQSKSKRFSMGIKDFFRRKSKKNSGSSYPKSNVVTEMEQSLKFACSLSACNTSVGKDPQDLEEFEKELNEKMDRSGIKLQMMAYRAKRHLEPLVRATISNKRINDKMKLSGFLMFIERIEEGDLTALRSGGAMVERIKEHVARMFENVYKIADREVKQKKLILDNGKIQLLKTLVTKYHIGKPSHINILAIYIGRELIDNRNQLEEAILYLMGTDSTEVNLEQFEKNCGIKLRVD